MKLNEVVGNYKLGGITGGKVGAVIGERGATLRRLEADSGTTVRHIHITIIC